MALSDQKPLGSAELVHPKHTCVALHDMQNDFCTEDKVLRIQGIETVLLMGVPSHAGILGTYFGLLDCGYHFYLPRECVAGYVPELHEAAMKIMGPHVTGVAEIVAAWNAAPRSQANV